MFCKKVFFVQLQYNHPNYPHCSRRMDLFISTEALLSRGVSFLYRQPG